MKSMRQVAFVALLVAVVGVGAFFAGFWQGQQQQARNTQSVAVQDRSIIANTSNSQTAFGAIVRHAKEQVYDDERQRSHLTDEEARVALDWAAHWIENQVLTAADESTAKQLATRALSRVRLVINAIYALKESGEPGGK